MNPRSQPSLLLPFVATVLAYVVVGAASLLLAMPPSYASPLYPAAGLALGCALVYGPRLLPAVALAAFAVNLPLQGLPEDGWPGIALPAAIGVGAALQAGLGAWLVHRFVAKPLVLSEPRDVARFFLLGGPVACLVSASVAVGTQLLLGRVPADGAITTWGTWWVGDTLGVLIGAPVTLTLVGRPRAHWVHRRSTVGVSLVVVTALLATATGQVARWDKQRTWVIFERDATRASDALVGELDNALHALEAVRGTAAAMDGIDRETLARASAYWLAQPFHVKAIGWAPRVPRVHLDAFDAEVQHELDLPNYRAFDRLPGDIEGSLEVRTDADALPVRYIEPQLGNTAALGVNLLSTARGRPAIAAALASGRATASGSFHLLQDPSDQAAVVVYQALYDGYPADDDERRARARGMLFISLRMEEALDSVAASMPSYLQWCLVDEEPMDGPVRLAGAAGCERTAASEFTHPRAIDFAGRRWQLRLSASGIAVPDSRHWNAWMFSAVGLMATGMLGALLLSVTGRTRRIEVAVAQRTADLQREVAERTRTSAALRESEQRFRNILDHVPIGVIYTDLNGRIKESNPKLREMVGYDSDALAHMSSTDLTHPDDRAGDLALAEELVRGKIATFRRQKRFVAKDGKVLWVQAGVTLLRDGAGRPERMVGVVEDITEHLRLQDAERARERAEAANRAKSEFVSRMSHELRTPLNAMLGFAQLLELDREQPLGARQVGWTSQIQQAGWHLLHMINDTLDLSRIESGSVKLQTCAVLVAEVVTATRVMVEQAAAQRGVVVTERLDPLAQALLGDPTRVKQILTNLLSNAVKYNVEGGRVQVCSRHVDAHMLEIEVSDTGLGMDAQQMSELFQPFNRLGREAYGEGTGIGLVISRRLAELMGGTLVAHSAAGVGSSFRLRLPAAPVEARAARAADEGTAAEPRDYRQRLVHYIEDNETNAEVMRGILSQRPQVRLEISAVGLDGLAAVRRTRPSLVLLDMHLPDVDGLELLRHLKQDPATADIPVIAVSADATSARIGEAMALGAAHYVTKPVNVAQILALIDDELEPQDTRFTDL